MENIETINIVCSQIKDSVPDYQSASKTLSFIGLAFNCVVLPVSLYMLVVFTKHAHKQKALWDFSSFIALLVLVIICSCLDLALAATLLRAVHTEESIY